MRTKLKPRRPDAHKGDFGRLFLIAGSRGYTGAAVLAGFAALRAGAGLITLGVPEAVYPVIARRHAEVMVRPFSSNRSGSFSGRALKELLSFASGQDILAVGPGLGQAEETRSLVRKVLEKTRQPVIVDADALNALEGHSRLFRFLKERAVLTPHPGEFGRVFGKHPGRSPLARKQAAARAAKSAGAIVVLKGHRTVVADPRGRVYVNTTGNPGMASGGTGDVLTGILGALAAQGLSLWDAACLGVYLHGLAGDIARKRLGELSLAAGDLIENLPRAILKVTGRRNARQRG